MELGCGLGFTGISLSKKCAPSHYTFTDCHHQVLRKLAQNIALNFGQTGKPDTSVEGSENYQNEDEFEAFLDPVKDKLQSQLATWHHKDSEKIDIACLDWEQVSPHVLRAIPVDVVLAAGEYWLVCESEKRGAICM